jgi:2-dehydropantoate 2-reductase
MSKVLIVGGGAIGQWLASLLHAQTSVTLLVRPRQKAALSDLLPYEVVDEPPSAFHDDIIFTVKAFQVSEAAAQVHTPSQRIWGFQNGIGSDSLLKSAYADRQFGAMTTTTPVAFDGPQVVAGKKGGLAWSCPDPVPAWLSHMGVACRRVKRVDTLKASKLLLNLTCNATCALLDALPQEVVDHRAMFTFEMACLREFLRVVKFSGIPLVDLPGYKVTQMAALSPLPDLVVRQILGPKIKKARGPKPPSLLLDLRAGRPQSEVDVLNGGVVAWGQEAGVATPANAWLHQHLSQVVADRRHWSRYRGRLDEVAEMALASLTRR